MVACDWARWCKFGISFGAWVGTFIPLFAACALVTCVPVKIAVALLGRQSLRVELPHSVVVANEYETHRANVLAQLHQASVLPFLAKPPGDHTVTLLGEAFTTESSAEEARQRAIARARSALVGEPMDAWQLMRESAMRQDKQGF
jgi:hypothetical protein